jgi:DNA-binding MarR family transcriptional regulator
MRVVWGFDHALQRRSKHMETTLGITAPQRLAIRVLGRFPGMQAGQLAKVLHLHPGTLSGILKRLERRGLISRRVDPRDRRRAVLGLTTAGRVFNVDAEGTVESAIQSCLSSFPPETVDAARRVLDGLTQALDLAKRRSDLPL